MDDDSAFLARIHSIPQCAHCSSKIKGHRTKLVQGKLLCHDCYGRTVVVDGRVSSDEQADAYFVRLTKEGRIDAAAEFLRKVKEYREYRSHEASPTSSVSKCANCGQSFAVGDLLENAEGRCLCRMCGPAGRVPIKDNPVPVKSFIAKSVTTCAYCSGSFSEADLVESDAGRFLCKTCGPGLHRRRDKAREERANQLRLQAMADAYRKELEQNYARVSHEAAREQVALRTEIDRLKVAIAQVERQKSEQTPTPVIHIDEESLRTIPHSKFEEWAVKAVGVYAGGTGMPNEKKNADMASMGECSSEADYSLKGFGTPFRSSNTRFAVLT